MKSKCKCDKVRDIDGKAAALVDDYEIGRRIRSAVRRYGYQCWAGENWAGFSQKAE
jgi:hypothetical protein